MVHQKSRELFERAARSIPGGVNSPVRAFRSVGGDPIFIERAEGPYLFDVDGTRYVDFIGSWGPMILGHAQRDVLAAVKKAAEAGSSYGAPTAAEVDLAELVCQAYPSMDMLRLTSSGTEAVMGALRVARGFTGRDIVVKCVGCYHGGADYLLVKAGSGAATLGTPDSAGIPASIAQTTMLLPYNDISAAEELFSMHGRDIAALIIEPVAGNMGCVPPRDGYLQVLRDITDKAGSLLVFDEVMTGYRVAYGGAQARYSIKPDMTCLGKIIGGGLPVGAYGGRREIMQKVAPLGPVYQAGTLSGNPLAVAAGLNTIKQLQDNSVYEQLEAGGARLETMINEQADKAKVSLVVQRVASMLTVFFSDKPVRNWDDAAACDTEAFARFHQTLLAHGVYWPPSQYEAAFLSLAHDEQCIAITKEAIAAAFDVL